MKTALRTFSACALFALAVIFSISTSLGATKTWNNTGTDFNAAGSWTGGAPATGDTAVFSTAEATQPNLTASISLALLNFQAAGAGYDITSSTTAIKLTLTSTTAGATTSAISGQNTTGTNIIDAPIVLGAASGTQTFNQSGNGGNLTVNGVISSTSSPTLSLTMTGTSTLTIAGNNTYTGATTIAGGSINANTILAIGNDNAFSSGAVGITSGITLTATATRNIANAFTWGASGTIGGSNNLTFSGSFTSSGAAGRTINITNSGTTTLSGNVYLAPDNTAAGGLQVNGTGALVISGVLANNSAANTLGKILTVNMAGGSLTLSNANTYTGGTVLSQGTLILGNKAAFGGAGGGTVQWNGVSTSASTDLSGPNAIATNGTFGGTNIFTGTNNIELSGSLTEASGRTTTNNMTGGAVLTYSGAFALSSGATNATHSFNGSGNTVVSGVVSNGPTAIGSLTQSGAGSLTLSGAAANTYTGLTTVSNGELDLNKTAGVNAIAGDASTASNDVSVSGGTLKWLADNQVGDTVTITASGGTVDLNGKTETLGSLIVNSGIFQTGTGHLTGTTASMTFAGGTSTVNSGGIVEDGHMVVTGGTNTVQGGATEGLLHLLSGGLGLQMTGGNITLNSDNTTPGRLLLDGNVSTSSSATTSSISSGGAATNAGVVDMNGGTRTFTVATGTTPSGIDLSIGAKVTSPGGAISKAGTGTMELTGANTYGGGTTVTAGTLLANNTTGSATGSAGVMINAGGTLGGTGFIVATGSNININDNGTITGAKNGTVGALTMTASNVIFGGSAGNLSTYAVDISGATSDRLNITGVLDLSSAFDQIAFNGTADGTTTYVLATYTSETGTFNTFPTLPAGYSLVYGANELDLAPVPEASTWVMGALALAGIVMFHRSRRTANLR